MKQVIKDAIWAESPTVRSAARIVLLCVGLVIVTAINLVYQIWAVVSR